MSNVTIKFGVGNTITRNDVETLGEALDERTSIALALPSEGNLQYIVNGVPTSDMSAQLSDSSVVEVIQRLQDKG